MKNKYVTVFCGKYSDLRLKERISGNSLFLCKILKIPLAFLEFYDILVACEEFLRNEYTQCFCGVFSENREKLFAFLCQGKILTRIFC